MATDLLTIGELAEQTNLAPSALRYYEDLGLLRPASRVGGQRRYSPSALGVVGVILLLRDVGFTLAEIRTVMDARSETPDGWRQLTRQKLVELDETIAKARVARVVLEHALKCRYDDIVGCPKFQAVVADRLAGRSLEDFHQHAG